MNPNYIQKTFEGTLAEVKNEMNYWLDRMASQIEELKILENPKVNLDSGKKRLGEEQNKVNFALKKPKSDQEKDELNKRKAELVTQIKMLNCLINLRNRITETNNSSVINNSALELFDTNPEEQKQQEGPPRPNVQPSIPLPNVTNSVPNVPVQQQQVQQQPSQQQPQQEEEIKHQMPEQPPISEGSVIREQCKDFMRFARDSKMPECFEKTLVRIIYMMSLLSCQEAIEDSILFIETKEGWLNQLKADLSILRSQMDIEQIDDTAAELFIREVVRYYDINKPAEYRYEYLNPLISMLVKNIRPFNFQEFFELVQVCDTNSERIKNQSIILILGTTGAGKSTTIQYLFGAPMKVSNGHIQAYPMPEPLKDFISSSAMRSITRYINPLKFSYENVGREEEEITVVDTPGFGDTQSVEVDISNTLGIIRSVSKASQVYPVFIFNEKNSGGRAEIMKGLIEFYACMIKNMSTNKHSVNFFFSHFADKQKNMKELMTKIITDLNPQEHTRVLLKEVLKHMEDKAGRGELLILDPLDGNHLKVLHQIVSTTAISNPKNAFNLNIMERSRTFLDKQVAFHERAILRAVERGDTLMAEYKIKELQQLADVFAAHEQTYKHKLQAVVTQIKTFVTKIIDTVQERIQTCMKGGNQLYDTDIEKFKEALAFERKLSPLIANINSPDNKREESKIQSDQQSPMVLTVISQCETILAQLSNNHEINEDQWVLFIQKAMNLSKSIKGFELVEKNALQKYQDKFCKLALKAQKIITEINISHYSEVSQYQSQETRNELHNSSATKILNLNKKATFKDEDDDLKTDSEMEPSDKKKGRKNPNVLSSSEEEKKEAAPMQKNKIAECMMRKLKLYKEKMEQENNKAQKHKRFAELVAFLLQGISKIKVIEKPDYIANLKSLVDDLYKKVQEMDQKVKPYISFHQHDLREGYKKIDSKDITKIRQALTMLENFHIVCKVVDEQLGQTTGAINSKYVKKCYDQFENHYKFLLDVLQRSEVKEASASEVKERFEQILLLRQIPQIENQTNGPYHTITVQLQNQLNFSKNEIIAILQEFNDFTSVDSGSGNRRGLQNLFKRLNTALKAVKTLSEAASDKDNFMKKIFYDIQQSFENLISKLENDVSQYLNLREENAKNLRPVAGIYEQIQQIYECAHIIDIQKGLKQDVGLKWLKDIKDTLVIINKFSEEINERLMVQSDYRKFQLSSEYLKQFTEGQIPQCLTLVLNHINSKFPEPEGKLIEPKDIFYQMNVNVPNQKQFQITAFNAAFEKLKQITDFAEEVKQEEPQENLIQKTFSKQDSEMKKQIDELLKLFKLAFDVNARYPDILKIILEKEQNEDNFIVIEYTKRFKSDFFDQVEKKQLIGKPRQWIYLKLQAMKQLKELDAYITPPGQAAHKIYQDLDDQYYHDPSTEFFKAQQSFKSGDYKDVLDQLNLFSQPPVNEHAQGIITKIKNYINQQAKDSFELMSNYICDDYCLTNEETKTIAQQTERLMKMNVHLSDKIRIRDQTIISQIENKVFAHLQKCFDHLSEKIDKCTKKMNFTNAMKKIEEMRSLFTIIHQEVQYEVREMAQYKQLSETNTAAQKKKEMVKGAIEKQIEAFAERDIYNATNLPHARTFFEDIEKSKSFEEQAKQLTAILVQKYTEEKTKIDKSLLALDDPDELELVEKNVERLIDTLLYMPTFISDQMRPQLNNLVQSHRRQAEAQQERQNQVVSGALQQSQDPAQLAAFLKKNNKFIKEDQKKEIRQNISKQYQGILAIATQQLEEFRLQDVISVQIPKMKEYMKDPTTAMYVSPESQLEYSRILPKINTMFLNAISELSKYFIETHSQTGERILNGNEQEDQTVQLPEITKSLKVLSGLFSSYASQRELIERECVSNLEGNFREFLINGTEYIRRVKAQHQLAIKNKVIQEAISAISNLKYTNKLLAANEFNQTLNQIQGLCDSTRKEFADELKQVSVDKMQKEVLDYLSQAKDVIVDTKAKFVDPLRSEKDRSDFYKLIQTNFDLILLAQSTENNSIIKERGPTKIGKLVEEAQSYCEKKIQEISVSVQQFNKKINEGGEIPADQFEQFGVFYKSLKSMLEYLKISRNVVEQSIEEVEGTLSRKLTQMKKNAKEFYANEQSLNLFKLSMILCEIQQMRENMTLFEDQIMKTLDQILEDYAQFRVKDKKAASDLQSELRGIPGPYGGPLSQNHSYFKGVNILQANEKFQSKKIDKVLEEIKGTDLDQDEKDQLELFYNHFLAQYSAIIDDMLTVRRNEQGEKIPMDLSGIKAAIKTTLSKESSKKWLNSDVFGQIKFGKPLKDYKNLSILLANIFALWSLMNSEHYKKAEDMDASQTNLKGYLLQPHVAQILSILRILGVGYKSQYNDGPKFNKNWSKVFGESSDVRNNLVQIKTGEGKSVTLAVVSMIFALNGFEVKCACYSKYLSLRDYESFEAMFTALNLQDLIKYGTFNEVAELQINREGELRSILTSHVLKQEFQTEVPKIDLNDNKRPQVLLIDEVDVFFSDDFYGKTYNPRATIKHSAISALIDYIWQQRQIKIEQVSKMTEEQKEQEKSKQPYMSLKGLKETDEYKNAMNIFKPEYQFLVEEAAKKMIIDVVEFDSPTHHYVVHEGMIGYENQDQISTNAAIGYQTLFAYYFQNKIGPITQEVLDSKKAIGLDCATFSYAEVPLEYEIILGVTGTLETLSAPQKEIISQVYGINHHTLSPSVHSSEDSKIFNRVSGVNIVLDESEYYLQMVKEMEQKYLKYNRPVIFFFENNTKLNDFKDSEVFKNYKYQILNERDNNKEKALKVLKATQARTITLSTRNFGRGTDFCCFDKEVIESGGLVVIQTFLSEDLSEETQIRGRTGRQGTSGTYLMFLNLADLSKFNIELEDIQKSGNYYETLCLFRNRNLDKKNQETTKNRNALKVTHDQSNSIISQIKNTVGRDQKLSEAQQKVITDYLLEMNKGVTFEIDFQVMKVLVLIDCTGSMGITLQKTKNCVGAMFEEARKALKEMDLSEDLVLMKIAGYRNYSSCEKLLLQGSPEWTSNPNSLTSFLNDELKVQGGQGNEAIEIGLQFANKEIKNNQGVPLSMIIIIGDAAPNTVEEVKAKREYATSKYGQDWSKTKDYKKPTHWETEIQTIQAAEVPVHSFYLLNEKILPQNRESSKQKLEAEFKKLSVNGGQCAFLDIHDEVKGQDQLKEFFKYLIVYRATEINLGKDAALKSVSNFKVSFT